MCQRIEGSYLADKLNNWKYQYFIPTQRVFTDPFLLFCLCFLKFQIKWNFNVLKRKISLLCNFEPTEPPPSVGLRPNKIYRTLLCLYSPFNPKLNALFSVQFFSSERGMVMKPTLLVISSSNKLQR